MTDTNPRSMTKDQQIEFKAVPTPSDDQIENAARMLWDSGQHLLIARSGRSTAWDDQPRSVKNEYRRNVRTVVRGLQLSGDPSTSELALQQVEALERQIQQIEEKMASGQKHLSVGHFHKTDLNTLVEQLQVKRDRLKKENNLL